MPPGATTDDLDRLAPVLMSIGQRHGVTRLRHFPNDNGVIVATVAAGVDLEEFEALLLDTLGIEVEVMPDTVHEVLVLSAHLGRPLGG